MASTLRAPAWKMAVALIAIHSKPNACTCSARRTTRSWSGRTSCRRRRWAAGRASPGARSPSGRGRRPRRGGGSRRSSARPGRRRRSTEPIHPSPSGRSGAARRAPCHRSRAAAAHPAAASAPWRWRRRGSAARADSMRSSPQHARSSPMASSIRRPRAAKSSPSASYSASCQPTPMPRRIRPPDSVSSVLVCLATSTAWRCGSTSTSVDSSSRSVTAATKPSVTSASRIGICDGYIGARRVSVA